MRRIATVFGGTGFIGRAVAKRLAQRGFILRIVSRDPVKARRLSTLGGVGQIVPFPADIASDEAVRAALAGAEVAVNLIGILYERRRGDFDRLQGELPGRIGRMAAAEGVARLVHVSAIGADAASPSAYARSKAAGEAALRAAFPAAVILRPSIVFGPEDSFFNRFAAMAAMTPFVFPVVSGDTRFQPVHVADVADAVMAALEREDAAGRSYELGGPRVWTMRELMAFMLEATGRRRRLIEMPPGLMRLQAKILEKLPDPPLTQDQLLLLGRDNVVSEGMPGLAELGIAPRSVEATVPDYLKRFRPGGGRREAA
ncbi:MAG: complex I NDUFA9 subunit family protein [Acetobacteraceae bacterium]|nr:complex I NDUFA9 subunit family protein [Acetobacteraceae bacterium]MDW8399014.1 complex I NDUFA9 subunit family protein [Acetobacteraceae bacterium]